jgi:hypothetical protein
MQNSLRNFMRQVFQITQIIMLMVLSINIVYAGNNQEPFNKIAIIVDNSGSYSSRQAEAIDKAIILLESISGAKISRWETASDQIVIISLDAIPEVIWKGSLNELKKNEPTFWKERFLARTDYVACTDVAAAFRLAVRQLEGDSRYIRKYMFVFSDLIDEPPADSMYKPIKRSGLPIGEFPWEGLQDVSVSVFWLPPDQKLIWQREVEQRGISSNFALYTDSESAEVAIQAPQKPIMEITEGQRKANQKQYFMSFMKFVKYSGIILCVALLPIVVIVFGLRFRNRQSPQVASTRAIQSSSIPRPGNPPSGGPRPARPGTIPPLRRR